MVNMQQAGKGQRRSRRSEASTPELPIVHHLSPDVVLNEAAARDAGGETTSPGPGDLLTPEQEKLMVEHLPIVRFIARRIHERLPQHVPIEDLYSAGVVGLLDAFGKFDPSKQVQFRSYAQFRIRGAILDSLRTLDWSPRELRRKGRAIEQAIQTLTAQFGRAPNDLEIAHQLNIDLAAYQQLLGELKGLEIGTNVPKTLAKKSWCTCPIAPRTIRSFVFSTESCASGSARPSANCPSVSGWS
jgi:RNA polymerase sigma factor (sigma-70 family)